MISADRNEEPRYWAFISYSHHDRRVARWCRDQLARQAVSRAMRDSIQGRPRHFSAVFLDEETLAAAPVLSEELQAALRLSSHLIVICSPFAVASDYVNEEIRYFQMLGRGDRILCLVASGVPNATDEGRPHLECFPEALRIAKTETGYSPIAPGRRPLAAVLGDESASEKQRALRQLTTGLLGISDHALRQMESRKRITLGLAYTATSFCFLFLLFAFVLPWRTYSRDYVRVHGIWQEVDKISVWEASRTGDHYEFFRPGFLRRPQMVKFRNGFGGYPNRGLADVLGKTFDSSCTTSKATNANFTYEGKRIAVEELVDQYGTKLETMTYAPEAPLGRFLQRAGFGCSQSHAGVHLIQFKRNAQGFDEEVRFLDDPSNSGQPDPRANDDGVYGFRLAYDRQGHVTSTTNLSKNGSPQISREGYAIKEEKHDSHGWSIETRYLSATHEPVLTRDGVAIERRTFNSHGSVLEESNYGLDDNLIASASENAVLNIRRGWHGEVLTYSYFDSDRKPVSGKDGYAAVEYKYDGHGNAVELRYLDTTYKPTSNTDNIAKILCIYNSDGNLTKQQFFDVAGKPAFIKGAYAQEEKSYDERGNPAESRYLGLNGQPVRAKSGASIFRMSFDKQNRVVSTRTYDTQGQPDVTGGYFEMRITYDDSGNETERQYLGSNGQLSDVKGVARVTSLYDSAGLNIEKRSFGRDGQPAVTDAMGNASVERYEHDSLGRVVKTSYLDVAGNPSTDNDNLSFWTETLDAKGRAVDVAFFGPDGKPVKSRGNAFRFHRDYDSRGHEVLVAFQDESGNSMLGNEGYAYQKEIVNALGYVTSARFFGVSMQPVTLNGGDIAGYDATFDSSGNQMSYRQVGVDGQRAADEHGIAAYTYEYNQGGDQTAIHFWSVKNEAVLSGDNVSGWASKYDERHLETERVLLGTTLQPAVSPKLKYAVERMKYNDQGNLAESAYLDTTGHLVLTNDGYAMVRMIYDSQGNNTESRYFDLNGQPARERGTVRIVRTYNKFGQLTETRSYDADDNLTNNLKSGRAIMRRKYDDAGRLVLEASFDVQDHPVNRLDQRYWSKATTYGPNGKATSVCTTVSHGVITCPLE